MSIQSKKPIVSKEIVRCSTDGNYTIFNISAVTGCLENFTLKDAIYIRDELSVLIREEDACKIGLDFCLIKDLYRKPKKGENAEYLSAVDILKEIHQQSDNILLLTPQKIGAFLSYIGCKQVRKKVSGKRPEYLYEVIRKGKDE